MQRSSSREANYKWCILLLAALTCILAVAAPSMCLSVLFKEISAELNLSLVQVGLVWGMASLPGIFTSLAAGAIGDRFGPKRILSVSCLLVGLAGALRGLASNLTTLLAAVFLLGMLTPLITTNVFKATGMWFPRQRLGLANGILSVGMAMGFLIGSMFSATLLSPWLGGWRHVLFFYGAIAMTLGLPWYLTRPTSGTAGHSTGEPGSTSLSQAVSHIVRVKGVWQLGLVILCVSGCVQGALGYLPLYLRGLGWPASSADGALATFHTMSMIGVIPIALWSDRLGSRKTILIAAGLFTTIGVGLLAVVDGGWVWMAVSIAGLVRDGFMAISMTAIVETEGVGPMYAGTAVGLVMAFGGVGSLVSPPLGNSLATIAPSAPFAFWAGLLAFGILGLALFRVSPSSAL